MTFSAESFYNIGSWSDKGDKYMNIDLERMPESLLVQTYIYYLANVFNTQALFSDGTKFFRDPPEPDAYSSVTIRFRSARENLDEAYLVVDDEKYLMTKFFNDRYFDYYEYTLDLTDRQIHYYFELHYGNIVCYYFTVGLCRRPETNYSFTITPGFHTPDWAKGAVMYQIYTDRFYNGDRSNDVLTDEYYYIGDSTDKVDDWEKYPAQMGVREFYGGDLEGVLQKMDYLQDLGIEVIYFNPLFVSPSNHKYDIQDYDNIDPHFGKIVHDEGELLKRNEDGSIHLDDPSAPNRTATRYIDRVTNKANLDASNELFAKVVEEAHRRGIKVILDGVFNHCGSFNKWLDRERIYENAEGYEKGAFVSKDSPYHTFFKFREDKWPYNYYYDGWWGHDTLPKLNYEDSRALFDYIMHVARKWVSPPYNVDGWRLDVAADLGQSSEYNHYFWQEFRRNVKEANPNAIILAEHYGDPASWLNGDQWDTVMNYDAFMEPVTWFFTGLEKHSDEERPDMYRNTESFVGSMRYGMSKFNTQSLQVAMNELSNHDHSRFLTRTNHKVGRTQSLGPDAANEGVSVPVMRLAVLFQFTWPGAPTVYYGDEAGVCGWTDPDNRRTYPWGHENHELIDFHKQVIRIHKDYQAFRTGSVLFLDEQYGYFAFGRFDMKDKIVVAINMNDHDIQSDIPVWRIGIDNTETMAVLMTTDQEGFSLATKIYNPDKGFLHINMRPYSGVIIKNFDN
jgi:alpha-glucosidase